MIWQAFLGALAAIAAYHAGCALVDWFRSWLSDAR